MRIKGLFSGGLLAGAIVVGLAMPAESGETGLYVGASALGSIVGDIDFDNDRGGTVRTADFDNSFGGLARLGYDFGQFRAELEFGHRTVDVDSVSGATDGNGDIDVNSYMVNGVLDFGSGSTFSPYVVLGAGIVTADGNISYTGSNASLQTKNFDKSAPAGQLGLGVRYGISDSIDLTGGYSLLLAPTSKTNESEVVQIHSFNLGFDFKF